MTRPSAEQGPEKTTHFGFEEVPVEQKAARVGEVFSSVAGRYDLMNDLMSLGVHRLWKRFAVSACAVRRGEHVLDLAGGTGDLSARLAQAVGEHGSVVLADINAAMLEEGRRRLTNEGRVGNIRYSLVDAQSLPFADNSFDCVIMGFGLRNVTDKDAALASIFRTLKPGGRLVVLEFSKPVVPGLATLYDLYSFNVLPRLGGMVAGDADSYRYLVESIRMHPDQDTLLGMMAAAGLERCRCFNLSGGIVAVHRGYKL